MVLVLVASLAFAQEKSVKEAKSIANSPKPDFKRAEQLITGALSDASTKDNAETWNVAGFVQKRWSEEENKKIYLQQPVDTMQYYGSLLKMCQYYLKCDDLAQMPNEKGKIKNKYRKANSEAIKGELNNLINGGVEFYNNNKSKEALEFFGMYIDIAKHPMFAETNMLKTDTMIPQIAYYASLAANRIEDFDKVLEYAPYAEGSKEDGQYAMELMANAYKAKGDTAQWLATLKEGLQKYPDYAYFFGHLIDYYTNNQKNDEAMQFADEMLAKSPNNPFYLYVKGYLYHNIYSALKVEKKNAEASAALEKALEFYQKTIDTDPNYAEAYSNMGLIYCLQAQDYSEQATADINDPKYQQDQAALKAFYEKAKPRYEKARELKPDQRDLWLNGLHRVYYNLNMGPEFEAIDKIISGGN
jgi:tetratricopeptide (TPR) repeat protein